jgi:Sec-independent protein secretion pathway component TatC
MKKKVRSRAIRLLLVPFAATVFIIGWTFVYFADKKPKVIRMNSVQRRERSLLLHG